MKPVRLTRQEKAVIHDPNHNLYYEVIKGMSIEEMLEFDNYIPNNLKHYNGLQVLWLQDEQHLIAQRNGHPCKESELLDDIQLNHNSERFRVYYCFCYPHLVHRRDE